jgi:aryl-alcohol dehydrogenase-like predicted oxidoreductase
MRYCKVLDGGPEVSELGLGCAAMMGSSGRRDSLRALGSAWDAGITLYDTARSYGYGESESLLGEFFRGERRGRAVISTKFGILPGPRGWKQRIKPLAQAAVRAVPALRGVARRQAAAQLVQGEFSVDLLRTSLETSLRALKTDYVDLLLMHAAPMTALKNDDLLEAMERLVSEGKARRAGISAEHAVIEAAFTKQPLALTTAQFAMGLGSMKFAAAAREAATDGWFLVANRPFGGALGASECKRRIEAMRADVTLPEELRAKLKPDPGLMPETVLNMILRGAGVHAVIPAMMKAEHLAANVRAVEHCRFSEAELELLRAAMEAA